MARMRRRLVVGMVLLGLSGLTPVAAETIPLPKAAPQPKERRSAHPPRHRRRQALSRKIPFPGSPLG